jgi:hypothetical protein
MDDRAHRERRQHLLEAAAESAIQRLRSKVQMASDASVTFAEVGEAATWVTALADMRSSSDELVRAVRWARNQILHGQLLTETAHRVPSAMAGDFTLGESMLGGDAHLTWLVVESVKETRRGDPDGRNAYATTLARKRVDETLAEALAVLKGHEPGP